jgi:hypothetical protein
MPLRKVVVKGDSGAGTLKAGCPFRWLRLPDAGKDLQWLSTTLSKKCRYSDGIS